ncbi:hypothetical protein [Candidatus Berkiella aquae]|uniref:Glycosyltransferase RgtA/B/C/D-like domain-containing protein n=1 Tax=Candidatus Berkiella aquae TaxID=295108 RepID=A0A0Q9YP59_9GAMM|nr:hypothetical protein [Candidatus Berkiella aquae]MCS5712139.1 hypothetical protein [Candidatus Berkiella aquae]
MKSKIDSLGPFFLNLGAWVALLLVALRFAQVFSFSAPMHVITSGFEEESLFALFKVAHGLPVYTDPHQLPFTATYFNWFFYAFYGKLTTFVIHVFHLNDAWIPTIGRLITFAIVSAGFVLTYRLLRSLQQQKLAFSLSVLLWYGPLIGFWSMTVRPDLLGLFFDACAGACILHYFPQKRLPMVILAALYCYLSWSCKQINIVMPGAIGLLLLWRRQWFACVIFSLLLVSLYACSFALLSANARNMLFFVNTAIPLSSAVFLGNTLAFFKKTFPIWLIFVAVFIAAIRNANDARQLRQDPAIQLSILGLMVWSLILLPASSKVGSAENYHFIALLFLTLFIGKALSLIVIPSRMITLATAIAGLLWVGAIGSVILQNRSQALSSQHHSMTALQSCIATLPQPVFVINHYGALPWMNASPHTFVLAYNYWSDRQMGIPFEDNGIGGLIEKGYFNALILPSPVTDEFDGASLQTFKRQESCEGYAVFTRKGTV